MKNFTKHFAILATLLASLTILPAAQAVMVTGEINFTGIFVPTGGTTLGDATGIDFSGDGSASFGSFDVNWATADFNTFAPAGSTGTINNFDFLPSFTTVNPLWTLNGFSFALTALTVDYQSDSALVLIGGGIISGNGFDDTHGNWTLSGQGGVQTFSWSATTVSEPATLALMGLGLIGLAGIARRKKAA